MQVAGGSAARVASDRKVEKQYKLVVYLMQMAVYVLCQGAILVVP
jgi:hypothetical protein